MAQRLNRSKLFFGQLAGGQKPSDYKSTMSGFYGGVGGERTDAVQKIGEGVGKATAGLATDLGLTQTVDEGDPTKIKTTLGSPFTVTAVPGQPPTTPPAAQGGQPPAEATPAGAQPAVAPPKVPVQVKLKDRNAVKADNTPEFATDEDYLKYLNDTLTAVGSSVEEWKNSGLSAKEYIDKVLEENRKKAQQATTDAEKRLTEGKLGQRRAPSELEKQAESYQTTLAAKPGTSNVKALATLSQFYDPKYLTLESGLRQGEMALARQEAVGNVGAMQQAEAARAAAIGEYGKQSKELGQALMDEIGKQEEAKRKEFKDFYSTGESEAAATKKTTEDRIKETEANIEKTAQEELSTIGKELKDDPTFSSIENIINAISGRDSKDWLNTRGNEVLKPIKQEMLSLSDEADTIAKSPLLSTKEKTKRLKEIKDKVKVVRSKVAGELAAFLGDYNSGSGVALDAAEQIVAAGLINDLNENQKNVIMKRLVDNQTSSQDEKRQRIYSAFGGGSLEPIRAEKEKFERRRYGSSSADG